MSALEDFTVGAKVRATKPNYAPYEGALGVITRIETGTGLRSTRWPVHVDWHPNPNDHDDQFGETDWVFAPDELKVVS